MDDDYFEDELIRLLKSVEADGLTQRLRARKAELDEKAEKAEEAAMETEVWDALFGDE